MNDDYDENFARAGLPRPKDDDTMNPAIFRMSREAFLATQAQRQCPHCGVRYQQSKNDWRTRCPSCLRDTAS